jgi:tetratricopeptide (TPR) repeat protein
MDKRQSRTGGHNYLLLVCIMAALTLICGCSHINEEIQAANDLLARGNYKASLNSYQQVIEKYPAEADRALFEIGIIYTHPGNDQKDLQKSLECFQRLIKDYPESSFRKDSELMIFNISNVTAKDMTISAQQEQVGNLREEIRAWGDKNIALQEKIKALEQEVRNKEDKIAALQKEVFTLQRAPADKILIEKKERRLTLISKGKALKTYRIALGVDPIGPKERQGDNKTPEGTYSIDSRNRDSLYHLGLHISYPNEKDKKRARELGVSPGGDIMIHGIKNGYSWAGDLHTSIDWTKGCIAVTDE